MLHAVIMAGGSGTRFWPESRADRPKQLLPLAGERSLLEETVDRLASLVSPERMIIATAARLASAVHEQLPQLPAAAILGEPCKRDTAPCIGLAALHVLRHDPDATLAVMPSDHAIGPAAAFADAIRHAAEFVDSQPERMLTFGIRPTYPAESFGYIERGAPLSANVARTNVLPGAASSASVLPANLTKNDVQSALAEPVAPEQSGKGNAPKPQLFEVVKFREKPPAAVAREYLAAGNFFWNSGIFVWKARTILAALAEYQPEMVAHLQTIAAAVGKFEYQSVFEREFAAIHGISIDYAVLEKSPHVAMLEAPFAWDDVGSWQAMARLRGVDAEGNTVAGKHLGVDTTDSIIRATGEHLIATLGLHDMIVVHTPDATLVANRHDEESIRRIVKLLEERGWTEFL